MGIREIQKSRPDSPRRQKAITTADTISRTVSRHGSIVMHLIRSAIAHHLLKIDMKKHRLITDAQHDFYLISETLPEKQFGDL